MTPRIDLFANVLCSAFCIWCLANDFLKSVSTTGDNSYNSCDLTPTSLYWVKNQPHIKTGQTVKW